MTRAGMTRTRSPRTRSPRMPGTSQGKRRLSAALAAAVFGLTGLLAVPARADTRTLQGAALALTLTTDEDTTIETDPSLSRAIRVVADSTDCLDTSGNGEALRVSTAACGSATGSLTIMVPPAFPVSVTMAGSGNVRVGDLMGPFHATIVSDGDLTVHHATILGLSIRGSGDATIQAVDGPADVQIDGSGTAKITRLNGPAKIAVHGSGDVAIGQIQSPAAQIQGEGSGNIVIAAGNIAMLDLQLHGSGDFAMEGSVSAASVQASGGGDVKLPHVSTIIRREAHGGSTIVTGGDGIGDGDLRKLADSVDDGDSGHPRVVVLGHGGGSFVHFIAGILVLGLVIAGWRTINRNGGVAGLRKRMPKGGPPAPPSHPGVIALCELLSTLERRLARVETHVTSREFDLNRKFREIDAGSSRQS